MYDREYFKGNMRSTLITASEGEICALNIQQIYLAIHIGTQRGHGTKLTVETTGSGSNFG